jgi:hypothetical protein
MTNDRTAPATKGDLLDLGDRVNRRFEELVELMRDNETKLLGAFYSFAETNQKRLSEVEREPAAIKERLASLESRVTNVEKRPNMPPGQ